MRTAAVLLRHKIRERHRLAELLRAARERRRHHDRRQPVHDAHRSALLVVPRPSGPRVSRRPAADRFTILHEWRRAEVRARAGRVTSPFFLTRAPAPAGILSEIVS